MSTREKIRTWKWRIISAGYGIGEFAEMVGISHTLLSAYFSGKNTPSLERFDLIEQTLKEMGV